MKKLKKLLSLLLVVAMVFSFASTAFATEFVDYDQESATTAECYEAVQAMSGLGIIEGNGNSDLKPEGTFTRAAAAKIICCMLLGTEKAKALVATESLYTDVAVDEWYAPYVQFCTEAGIICGNGDGTFAPNANVTVNQWLKMLLGAVGFDTTKFMGDPDWAMKTYTTALKYGMITADEYKLSSEGMDREYAILYAWRALNFAFGGNDTMAESVFGIKGYVNVRDIYGAYVSRDLVTYDGDVIASFAIEPDAVIYNEAVKAADYKDYTFIEDGYETTAPAAGKSSTVLVFDAYKTVVIINEQIAEMNASNVKAFDKLYEDATLIVGDVITYTEGNDSWIGGKGETVIENISVLTPVVAKVTARDTGKEYVKLDGGDATYFAAMSPDCAHTMGVTVVFNVYIDAFGNIAVAHQYVAPARQGTLVFVTQSSASYTTALNAATFTWDSVSTKNIQYVDLTDGSLKIANVNTAVKEDGTDLFYGHVFGGEISWSYIDSETSYAWVYENENGSLDVEFIGAYNSLDTKKQYPYAFIGAADEALCTAETNYTEIQYADYFQTVNYITSAGVDTFKGKEIGGKGTYVMYFMSESGKASDIYVITPYVAPGPKVETKYAMFIRVAEEIEADTETCYYEFVLANGEIVQIPGDLSLKGQLTEDLVYQLTITDDRLTAVQWIHSSKSKSGTAEYAELGYIHVKELDSTHSYKLADGVVVINYDAEVTEISYAGFDKNMVWHEGDSIKLYFNDKGEVAFIICEKTAPTT